MEKENRLKMNLQFFADGGGQPEPDTTNDTTNDTDTTDANATPDQDVIDKAVQARLAREKKEHEKALQDLEEKYQAQLDEVSQKLSAKDKEEFDLSKAQREIDKLKKQLEDEQSQKETLSSQIRRATIQDEAIKALNEKGVEVNDEVLQLVVKDSAEDTLDAIENLSNVLSNTKKRYSQSTSPVASGGLSGNDENKTPSDIFRNANILK